MTYEAPMIEHTEDVVGLLDLCKVFPDWCGNGGGGHHS